MYSICCIGFSVASSVHEEKRLHIMGRRCVFVSCKNYKILDFVSLYSSKLAAAFLVSRLFS